MTRIPFKTLGLMAAAAGCLWLASLGCMDGDAMDAETPSGSVSLTILSKAVAAPGDNVEVKATVTGNYYQVETYAWTITDPNGGTISSTAMDTINRRVTFKVSDLGTHTITCRATLEASAGVLDGSATILVDDPSVLPLSYTARIIPTPSSGFPPTDKKLSVGRADQTSLQWTLDGGQPVKVQVEDDKAGAQAAYVRLFRTGADPMPRDIYLPGGEGTERLTGVFHALFLPDSATVAPYLKLYVDAGTLSKTWKVSIPKALAVSGKVTLESKALAGAGVALHTREKGITVPSTPAKSGKDGAYSVGTRSGSATFTVVPPAASGLPVALVQDSQLSVWGAASGWTFDYAKAAAVAKVSGKVTRSDGSTPAAGATVLLRLASTVDVGTLKNAAGTFKARGLVRRTLEADATGALKHKDNSELTLLPGTYELEAWPGSKAPAGEGYAKQTLVVAAGKAASFTVKLSPRATVKGKVLDAQKEAVRASVTATGPTGTFSTATDGQGAFSLTLDDKASYRLTIRAMGSSKVSSWIQPALKVAGGGQLPTYTLPEAVTLSGKVTTTGNLALAGALIRVWCSGTGCASGAVLEETHTRGDGSFALRLPKVKK